MGGSFPPRGKYLDGFGRYAIEPPPAPRLRRMRPAKNAKLAKPYTLRTLREKNSPPAPRLRRMRPAKNAKLAKPYTLRTLREKNSPPAPRLRRMRPAKNAKLAFTPPLSLSTSALPAPGSFPFAPAALPCRCQPIT